MLQSLSSVMTIFISKYRFNEWTSKFLKKYITVSPRSKCAFHPQILKFFKRIVFIINTKLNTGKWLTTEISSSHHKHYHRLVWSLCSSIPLACQCSPTSFHTSYYYLLYQLHIMCLYDWISCSYKPHISVIPETWFIILLS